MNAQSSSSIHIGFNGRFFPQNWRPARQEIEFASDCGFQSLQFRGKEEGLNEDHLGGSFETVRQALEQANIIPVMEMLIGIDANGRSPKGNRPLDILQQNLPAITALNFTHVHWHLMQAGDWEADTAVFLETHMQEELAEAVALGRQHGFTFGIEHNNPLQETLFNSPEKMEAVLTAVPHLGLVWDMNHPTPEQVDGFKALAPQMSLLHIADTPMPKVNYHLPLGEGNLDFANYFAPLVASGFAGCAILEIGGTKWSGGYEQDTDEALIRSKQILETAVAAATKTL